MTSWAEQRNKYAIIADHRLVGSRDVDVHGGRDSTPSMGVIVAGIQAPCGAVVKCRDASMGSEAREGKAEPPLVWCSGLFLF